MKKILIPILLLPLAFTSCKKQQIKKETKSVSGTFRGQKELYHEESHIGKSALIIDTAYNLVKEVTITIEKDDDTILVYEDGYRIVKLKYAGNNMQSTYGVWDKYSSRHDTIVYYPSKDSLFIVSHNTHANTKNPPENGFTISYFKGKRVSN